MTQEHINKPVLYWANGSIPSWQVLCLLHERGADFEARRLRVMSEPKETRTPAFLAINPRGQTPTWVEPDGRVVTESMALLFYLDRTLPGQALLPAEPSALGLALERTFQVGDLRAAYRPIEQLFLGASNLSPERREAARQAPARVREELALWEGYLDGRDYLLGESLTLADCAFYPALAYQLRRGLILHALPNLAAYVARMAARPGIQRAHPEGWGKRRGRDLFAEAAALT